MRLLSRHDTVRQLDLTIARQRFGLPYLFISHDLPVVRCIADQVLVMKAGSIPVRSLIAAVPGAALAAATAAREPELLRA